VYASDILSGCLIDSLLNTRNTRYRWLVRPYPTGTSTLQEMPSLAWRTDVFLPHVDRFIFFAGSARILYKDFISWIESSPKDVKISIDYLTSIMDNLEIPVQERGLFFMRPDRIEKNLR